MTETDTSGLAPSAPLSDRELVLARILDAPCAAVFRAWTEHLPDWWGPHGITTPFCEMELRPGGVFRTMMRAPDGSEYPTRGVFLEIVANERIVFSDAFGENWMPAAQPFMVAIATFEALPGQRTRYTARALHWSVADREKHEQMGFHQGWSESLERLVAVAKKL